jgi:hypothetical protein
VHLTRLFRCKKEEIDQSAEISYGFPTFLPFQNFIKRLRAEFEACGSLLPQKPFSDLSLCGSQPAALCSLALSVMSAPCASETPARFTLLVMRGFRWEPTPNPSVGAPRNASFVGAAERRHLRDFQQVFVAPLSGMPGRYVQLLAIGLHVQWLPDELLAGC